MYKVRYKGSIIINADIDERATPLLGENIEENLKSLGEVLEEHLREEFNLGDAWGIRFSLYVNTDCVEVKKQQETGGADG